MTSELPPVRQATAADADELIRLWGTLFEDSTAEVGSEWMSNARNWFADAVRDGARARFPVVEVAGEIVATAIGTLELGVPNPQSPRGRLVRLANVITLPTYRRRGFATAVVTDVLAWARSIDADRVDLSTTADGEAVYQRVGFERTKAPRMKLVL